MASSRELSNGGTMTQHKHSAPFSLSKVPYHIQLVFLLTFGYIWYTSWADVDYLDAPPEDEEEALKINRANWWRGIINCVLFLCAFSYLDPSHMNFFAPMQRFWRMVGMLAQLYICFIIILLNHRPEYGRWILGYLDPRLNVPVTSAQHTYDDNCEFTWANFYDNLDHYYLVHWGDWFLSTFMLREFYVLHSWQLMDEIVELSWQHILPHFGECWWDHVFVDILFSNIPAIALGLWI